MKVKCVRAANITSRTRHLNLVFSFYILWIRSAMVIAYTLHGCTWGCDHQRLLLRASPFTAMGSVCKLCSMMFQCFRRSGWRSKPLHYPLSNLFFVNNFNLTPWYIHRPMCLPAATIPTSSWSICRWCRHVILGRLFMHEDAKSVCLWLVPQIQVSEFSGTLKWGIQELIHLGSIVYNGIHKFD